MPGLNPARPETAIEDQTTSHAEAASSGFSMRRKRRRRMEVSIRPSKIRTRNRRDRERGLRGVVTVDVSSTPYKTPFLGKEVPDDHQPDHAANRRISILRPHDGGDGADRRPAWEVAEEPGGGETAPDSPELIERRPTHGEVACDGPDTGGCRDHSCGTLDSNPCGGGPAASAGRSVPVGCSATAAERGSDDHPPERIQSPSKRKTPQPPRAPAGSLFFRVETPRVRKRSSPATTASQSAETEQCDGNGRRNDLRGPGCGQRTPAVSKRCVGAYRPRGGSPHCRKSGCHPTSPASSIRMSP